MTAPKVLAAGEVPEEPENDDIDIEVDGPQSPLEILRGKRPAAEKLLFKDLKVPRWEETIGRSLWVRYKTANPALQALAAQKREKNHLSAVAKSKHGDPDWATKANADMLVDACLAVYDLPIDEEPPKELPTNLPTFSSPELSESLGAPLSAVATALAVYLTDADLILAAQQLLDWSGELSKDAGKDFLVD